MNKTVLLVVVFLAALFFYFLCEHLLGFEQHNYIITSPKDLFIIPVTNHEGRFSRTGQMKSEFDFNLLLPFLQRKVVIDVDDCLDELKINESIIKVREIPYCNYQRPIDIIIPSYYMATDLYPFSQKWSISLKFTNRGGPGNIHFRIKPTPKVELFLRLGELLFATIFFYLLAWQFRKSLR